MTRYALLSFFIMATGCPVSALSQTGPHIAPSAPQDTPHISRGKAAEFDPVFAAMKPAIEMARKTYPEARKRFLLGLPANHSFFVVTRLPLIPKGYEQVFVAVDRIDGDRIHGRIWSDILYAKGYKKSDNYSMKESQIIDWLITAPDGSEEGNYVGKMIDKNRANQPRQ